jgi:hypothetical protein
MIRNLSDIAYIPFDLSRKLAASGDALDAAICLLGAKDVLSGEAMPRRIELAQKLKGGSGCKGSYAIRGKDQMHQVGRENEVGWRPIRAKLADSELRDLLLGHGFGQYVRNQVV